MIWHKSNTSGPKKSLLQKKSDAVMLTASRFVAEYMISPMTLRTLLLTAAALTSTTPAFAFDPSDALVSASDRLETSAGTLANIVDPTSQSGALSRERIRKDGVRFLVMVPGISGSITAEKVSAIDRYAESYFDTVQDLIPTAEAPARFQGFRIHQYRDGETGLTYAVLVPRDRLSSNKLPSPNKTGSSSFCDALSAPNPPRAYPRHEHDIYFEGSVDPDANGIWYKWEYRFEAMACPRAGCTPSNYLWATDKSCEAINPQPNPQAPPTGGPTGGGNLGVITILPIIIYGNAGFGWHFECRYGDTPIDCYVG